MDLKNKKIAIMGLGYVGLPLAIEFSKKFEVVGYDINKVKIREIEKIYTQKKLSNKKLKITSDDSFLNQIDIFIVTVPTPINKDKTPDLKPLKKASKLIGEKLKRGDVVIYESTVYPGLTDEISIPILEKKSKLKINKDFLVGYSPERVSPGDKNDFTKINKIVSGSNLYATNLVYKIYKTIIKAKLFKTNSIKVAEASKIIENVQRDVNISFMNEVSLILSKLNINTQEVLEAAQTKWNFLNFTPGLVGGHCISVDPYYLTFKAKKHNYKPKVILSGRLINNNMGIYVANVILKKIKKNFYKKKDKIKIGLFGLTFKENTNDLRDSKVFDIIKVLNKKKNIDLFAIDPFLKNKDVKNKFKIKLNKKIKKLDVFILAVPHTQFLKFNYHKLKKILCNQSSIVIDIKGILKDKKIKENFDYWSL